MALSYSNFYHMLILRNSRWSSVLGFCISLYGLGRSLTCRGSSIPALEGLNHSLTTHRVSAPVGFLRNETQYVSSWSGKYFMFAYRIRVSLSVCLAA